MVQNLKNAMKIAQLEAKSGGKLTVQALAFAMNVGYEDVKRIVTDFGIVVPADLGAAGMNATANFKSADALVRSVDQR